MDLSPQAIGARLLRTRWIVRAPIGLFRVGLGWLFVGRILLLEHRGRVSGARRFVCLEVVERPARDRIVIVSGFGVGAQWYRNLQAHPECVVSVSAIRRASAVARFLADDEAEQVIARYQVAHPGAWDALRTTIERAVGHPVQRLPMVELTLTSGVLP